MDNFDGSDIDENGEVVIPAFLLGMSKKERQAFVQKYNKRDPKTVVLDQMTKGYADAQEEIAALKDKLAVLEARDNSRTEGWQARIAGELPNINPYRYNSDEYRSWNHGWMENDYIRRHNKFGRLWYWAARIIRQELQPRIQELEARVAKAEAERDRLRQVVKTSCANMYAVKNHLDGHSTDADLGYIAKITNLTLDTGKQALADAAATR